MQNATQTPDLARRLLIVDDDPSLQDLLAALALRLGYAVEVVDTGEQAIEAFQRRRPDLVTLDVVLPGMDGIETLRLMRAADPGVPVVMLSGHAHTRTIVEAVRCGASDFLRKPFEADELERALDRALAKARAPGRPCGGGDGAGGDDAGLPFLLGENPKMREIQQVIDHVADTDITVLIRGESGTGKELVAHTLCRRSGRRRGAFVKVNCAALPSELLESELFGFEKGAFTGAQRRKLGKFETANGGTIFLDEISEMHPNLQAKLLQVLQDGQFSRLGGEGDIRVDTRVIAATNRQLETAVREGKFREDLFYRLNVVSIHIPPLRERTDEIPLLVEHFLKRYTEEYGRSSAPVSERLLEVFLQYHWPGNVRELENLVKRMVVLGTEEPVLHEIAARASQLPGPEAETTEVPELERFLRGDVDRVNLKRIARQAAQVAEKRVIEKVLNRTRWNRKEAAQLLQISYKALLYKMKEAGLVDTA